MNIAVHAAGHIPSEHAHSIAVVKNANGFAKLGHNVDILTVERFLEYQKRKEIENINSYYDINEKICLKYFTDKTPFYFKDYKLLRYVSAAIRELSFGRVQYLFDPEKRMAAASRRADYDFCYCRTFRSAYHSIRMGIPTVVETHRPDTDHSHLKHVLELSDRPSFRGLVTISEQLRDNFIAHGVPPEKTIVLQDGVDLDRFDRVPDKKTCRSKLALREHDDLVVYTGALYEDKGIGQIIDVASQLGEVTFVLVGGPEEERKRWERRVEEDGLDNVRFEGFVPMHRVPMYQSAGDVLIMPYDTTLDIDVMDIETTSPLKLFEYLASSRPVVSTNIPAISRTIKHEVNGLLARPNDIEHLASLVDRVLADDKLSKQLSEQAYQTATEYQWKHRCQKIIDQFI
jgi:glycosyltransferase involved in cell wall biosynthesis